MASKTERCRRVAPSVKGSATMPAFDTAPDFDRPVPVLLVLGDEDLLVTRAVAGAVAAARRLDAATEVEDHAPGAFDADALMRLGSDSLFGGRQVVVVRSVGELDDELQAGLLSYAALPVEGTSLVLTSANGSRERSFLTSLRAVKPPPVVVQAARRTKPGERRDFVLTEARRLGSRMTADASWVLVDAVGGDLRALSGAVEQLCADTPGVVDEDDVARFFRGRAETSGFAVADAAVAGDLGSALALLRQALDTGTAAVLVASALATAVRDLAKVTAAGAAGGAEQAKRLGMPEWKLDKLRRSAAGWTEAGLARAVGAAARADAALKGDGADDTFALERLISQVVAARSAGSRAAAPLVSR